MFNLPGSIAAKAADWSHHLSPHALVASNRWSALTNGRVRTQTDISEIENLVNRFMLLTAGPRSDTLTLWLGIAVSFSRSLPPTFTSLSCQWCWQDVCDEGSGWCVCYANYSHNIHQHLLWIHHLFATGSSDAMNQIHLVFNTRSLNFLLNEVGFVINFVVIMVFLKKQTF